MSPAKLSDDGIQPTSDGGMPSALDGSASDTTARTTPLDESERSQTDGESADNSNGAVEKAQNRRNGESTTSSPKCASQAAVAEEIPTNSENAGDDAAPETVDPLQDGSSPTSSTIEDPAAKEVDSIPVAPEKGDDSGESEYEVNDSEGSSSGRRLPGMGSEDEEEPEDDLQDDEAANSDPSDDGTVLMESDGALGERLREERKTSELVQEWVHLRHKEREAGVILDTIMAQVGYEEVKMHCLAVYNHATSRHSRTKNPVLSIILAGNPGTGKKQMASLYAELLHALDLSVFYESRTKLRPGPRSNSEVLHLLDSKKPSTEDGQSWTLVVDVAPTPPSIAALQLLLDEAGRLPNKVHIVAFVTWSQPDEQSTISAFVPTTGEKIKAFELQDYTEEQLRSIFAVMSRNGDIEFEDGFDGPELREVIEAIARERGTPGFKNALLLSSAVPSMKNNYDRRHRRRRESNGWPIRRHRSYPPSRHFPPSPVESEKSHAGLTKADILGPTAEELQNQCRPWQKLEKLVGLEDIKATIRRYFNQVQYSHSRAIRGKRPLPQAMDRVFLGPPGSGKTTVALLLAKMLVQLRLVKGKIVLREATQLVAKYVGHSEAKVRRAVRASLGGILIIDNVDTLVGSGGASRAEGSTDSFRRAIVDAIVSEHQKRERTPVDQRLTIFLIGKTDTVKELFLTGNPGLSRVFPLDDAFVFSGYSDTQLGELLDLELEAADLTASPDARKTALDMLSIGKHRPNFAHASSVRALTQVAMGRSQARLLSGDLRAAADDHELEPADFDPDHGRPQEARQRCADLFASMQGMEYIVAQFQGYQDLVLGLRRRGLDARPYVPFSFVFMGPPGTGKTTVARKVASLFYDMGFLSKSEMVECSVAQLVYGGRANKSGVEAMFERALGKVLFVDEAYLLLDTGGGGAIGEVVDCMTKERFAGKLVVVLAGYEEDMTRLLQANRGIRSRFATNVTFRPMTPTSAITLLKKLVQNVDIDLSGLEPGEKSRRQAVRLLAQLSEKKSWANGRDVEGLARDIIQLAFKGKPNDGAVPGRITVNAVNILPMLASRLAKATEEDGKRKAEVENGSKETVGPTTESGTQR